MDVPVFLAIALAGYLLGSIPTGLLIGWTKGVDIRKHGSGNIGATNVFRTLGKAPGITVFFGDTLKGVLAVVLAHWISATVYHHASPLAGILGAVAVIIGHNFPVWLKFKGGKGVATSLGVIIGLVPVPAAISFSLWVALVFAFRYVSLASIIAAVSVPIAVAFTAHGDDRTPLLVFTALAALLIIARHRENIKRLLNGTESSFKKPKPSS